METRPAEARVWMKGEAGEPQEEQFVRKYRHNQGTTGLAMRGRGMSLPEMMGREMMGRMAVRESEGMSVGIMVRIFVERFEGTWEMDVVTTFDCGPI